VAAGAAVRYDEMPGARSCDPGLGGPAGRRARWL